MFALLVLVFLLLTRVPAAANYFSIDNVNLALALQNFDPRIHQPQPPGYPFFVLTARFVNFFLRDASSSFLVLSVLASMLSLALAYVLGKRLFDGWTAKAAVLLLLVNPVFWHTGLDGPLRPNLGLFSLLTAYCAWRAWNGERRYILWGAAALGIGSGFRPDLLAYLFPLWLASTWIGTRSVKDVLRGGILLSLIVVAWLGVIVYGSGGIASSMQLLGRYSVEQFQSDSVVMGGSLRNWIRQVNRLVLWNGLAVIGWVWAAPLFLIAKSRLSLIGKEAAFFALWLIPGLVIQAMIHVAAPGHTMFSIPALCLMGAYVLGKGMEKWKTSEAALSFALVANVLLFMNILPLPAADSPGGLYDAAAVGTFETSLENIRWMDSIHGNSIKEIADLSATDRKVVLLAQDVQRKEWFLNWRIARYYLPDIDMRVLADQKPPLEVLKVRGSEVTSLGTGEPVAIAVPAQARLLFLTGSDTALHQALVHTPGIQAGSYILYVDLPENAVPFQINGFVVTPAAP